MNKQRLLNTYVNNLTTEEVLERVDRFIAEKANAYIFELNVDVVMKIEKDPLLKEIADNAPFCLVDGKPLIWISKYFKNPIKEKISGSDLMPKLCEFAAKKDYSIFILGGKVDAAELAAKNLQNQFPGLRVAGTYSPPMNFEKDKAECDKINQMIRDTQPDILFVCFGCPKQEEWLYANKSEFTVGVSLLCGAAVDFEAGNRQRAPKFWSDHGLEWFYRFMKEPKRLFKRYFIDDMQIIRLMYKYRNEMRQEEL